VRVYGFSGRRIEAVRRFGGLGDTRAR
jgi:hypothetical protein